MHKGLAVIDIDWVELIKALVLAARWTLGLSVVAFIGGSIFGLGITLIRLTEKKVWVWLYRGYIELFQGTPLLMQLFLVFFGLPLFDIEVSPWVAASVALTLHASAYLCDIWVGCVHAIPKTQWFAGASLGMTRTQQLIYIIAPQALRIALAPSVGFLVQLIKGTALASIIGFVELTKTGNMLANLTYMPFSIYGIVALLYFVMCYPLTWLARVLENRSAHYDYAQ